MDTLHAALDRLEPDTDLGREFAQCYDFMREGHPLLLMMRDDAGDERYATLVDALRNVAMRRPGLDVLCVDADMSAPPIVNAPSNFHRIAAPHYLASIFLLGRARLACVLPEFYTEAFALGVPLLALEPLHLPEDTRPRVHVLGGEADAMAENILRVLEQEHAQDGRKTDNEMGDAYMMRIIDALAGLRSAAHASQTLSRDAGSPNLVGIGRA
jgi:hypothetical protein